MTATKTIAAAAALLVATASAGLAQSASDAALLESRVSTQVPGLGDLGTGAAVAAAVVGVTLIAIVVDDDDSEESTPDT